MDLSPLARLETRANDNHRLTPVATGMPPLRGFERILGQALSPVAIRISPLTGLQNPSRAGFVKHFEGRHVYPEIAGLFDQGALDLHFVIGVSREIEVGTEIPEVRQ